jgi:CheY-like chemotaxis protein
MAADRPKDVLIVEDTPVNQKLVALILQRAGYTYGFAENGEAALASLPDGYRLVMMDMMMPVMNGYDATRAIRADPRWSTLPIIALTANAMKGEAEKCKAIGCDDYIAKPYKKEQVITAVAKLIGPGTPPNANVPGAAEAATP